MTDIAVVCGHIFLGITHISGFFRRQHSDRNSPKSDPKKHLIEHAPLWKLDGLEKSHRLNLTLDPSVHLIVIVDCLLHSRELIAKAMTKRPRDRHRAPSMLRLCRV